jgi:protein subunit release factor A
MIQATELLKETSDEELKNLATSEIEDVKKNIEESEEQIKKLEIEKYFHDEDDSRNIILEIRAGAGEMRQHYLLVTFLICIEHMQIKRDGRYK